MLAPERAIVRSALACATWVPPFSSSCHLSSFCSSTARGEHALCQSDSCARERAMQCPAPEANNSLLSTRALLQHLRRHKQQQQHRGDWCSGAQPAIAHEHACAPPLPCSSTRSPPLPLTAQLQPPHCPPPHLRLRAVQYARAASAGTRITTETTPPAPAVYTVPHPPTLLGLHSAARQLSTSAQHADGIQQMQQQQQQLPPHAELKSTEGPSGSAPAAPAAAGLQRSTEASDADTGTEVDGAPAAPAAAGLQRSADAVDARAGAEVDGAPAAPAAAALQRSADTVDARTGAEVDGAPAALQCCAEAGDADADVDVDDATLLGLSNKGSAAWDSLDVIPSASDQYDMRAFMADYELLIGRAPSLLALRKVVQKNPREWKRTSWKNMMERVTDFVHAVGPHTVHAILCEAPQVVLGGPPWCQESTYKLIKNFDGQLSAYVKKHPFDKLRDYRTKRSAQEKITVTNDDPVIGRGLLAVIEDQDRMSSSSAGTPGPSHSQPTTGGDQQPLTIANTANTNNSNSNATPHSPPQATGQGGAATQGGFLQASPLTLELLNKRPQLAKLSRLREEGWLESKLHKLEQTLQLPPLIVWSMVRTLPWLLTVTHHHVLSVFRAAQAFMESDEMQPALLNSIAPNSKVSRNLVTKRKSRGKGLTKEFVELGVWPPANVPPPDASGRLPPEARSHVAACFVRTTIARRPLVCKFSPRILQSKLNRVHEFASFHESWRQDLWNMDHSELGLILCAPLARFNRLRYLQERGVSRDSLLTRQDRKLARKLAQIHKILHAKSKHFEAAFPGYFEWIPGQGSALPGEQGDASRVSEFLPEVEDEGVLDSSLEEEEDMDVAAEEEQ